MKTTISIIQIFVSLLLVFLILIQSKGGGLGSSVLGRSNLYSTRRGMEKIIFYITIALSVLFFLSSIIQFSIR